ncbi:MAG: response regulator transcription factor [Bryobacteraceae bacterium]|jgi:two-component system response regulator NreC
MRTRILLADDQLIVREGIRRVMEAHPDFTVVAEASTGLEALAAAERFKPDVAVLDVAMPQMSGIQATEQIKLKWPRIAVLLLSMYNDQRYIRAAVKAGASGYVLKDCPPEELIKAIQEVRQGNAFFSPSAAGKLVATCTTDEVFDEPYDLLTPRERMIYVLLAEGRICKDIAELLALSPRTVDTHRTHIMSKLRLHTAVELTLSAVHRGLIIV